MGTTSSLKNQTQNMIVESFLSNVPQSSVDVCSKKEHLIENSFIGKSYQSLFTYISYSIMQT